MRCTSRALQLLAVLLLGSAFLAAQPIDTTQCRTCHETAVTGLNRTPHAALAESCAKCHGDVSAHARSEAAGEGPGPIVAIKSAPPADINRTCLQCHDRHEQANWAGSIHDRKGLACTTCHSVHDPKSPSGQLRAARDADVCFGCHPDVRSRTMRASHHPIREGKMECGSCHDPHDGTRPGLIRAESVNELCYGCHAEMRGPFLWEHAPSRDDCLNCHTAHGSSHSPLLTAPMPWLCQRCHLGTSHSSALLDRESTARGSTPSNRMIGRSCSNCHRNVHGSNAPSGVDFGR